MQYLLLALRKSVQTLVLRRYRQETKASVNTHCISENFQSGTWTKG